VSRARPTPSGETLVVVEPGQADLLARFARQLQGTRQAASGVSLPRIVLLSADVSAHEIPQAESKEEVISHRTEWEKVGSDWPLLQRSF
jgi:hypothetical protein